MLKTPILFLIFNRADTTRRVFDAIRQQKPSRLYVASDGPRLHKQGEAEKVAEVRAIIDRVDWECEVKTLFREENLGCKQAVSSAITWFFEQEEMGIILEDDCLPDPSFFAYCEELLIKYKDDERVGHIGGNCYFPELIPSGLSYDFSAMPHIWGWATWRRVWNSYDAAFPYWDKIRHNKLKRKDLFINKREEVYFSTFLSDTLGQKNGINAWSIQYIFTLRKNSQLAIYPAVNLVTNIGLASEEATHTSKPNDRLFVESRSLQTPLQIPPSLIRNKELDRISVKRLYFSYRRLLRYLLGDY